MACPRVKFTFTFTYRVYDHYSVGSEFYQHKKLQDVEPWHSIVLHVMCVGAVVKTVMVVSTAITQTVD
jgi:hypothetical protein